MYLIGLLGQYILSVILWLKFSDEFSQKHIGELILDYKILSEADVLSICDEDNDYCQSWSDEKKIEVFCNRM